MSETLIKAGKWVMLLEWTESQCRCVVIDKALYIFHFILEKSARMIIKNVNISSIKWSVLIFLQFVGIRCINFSYVNIKNYMFWKPLLRYNLVYCKQQVLYFNFFMEKLSKDNYQMSIFLPLSELYL